MHGCASILEQRGELLGGNMWGTKQCPADSSNMSDFNNLILFIRTSLLRNRRASCKQLMRDGSASTGEQLEAEHNVAHN